MTVQSSLARISYTVAGAGPYTIPFLFIADEDLLVYRIDADSVSTLLTITTDYTLSGEGDDSGGALTLVSPTDGDTLIIVNNPEALQLVEYPEAGKFPSKSHERALDRLTILVKRALDLASRSFSLNDADAATSLELPTSIPGYMLGWAEDGTLTNVSPTGVGPDSIGSAELKDGAVTPDKSSGLALAGSNSDISALTGIANPAAGVGIKGYRVGQLFLQWAGYTNVAIFQFLRANGTKDAPTKALSGNVLGQIEFTGYQEEDGDFSLGAYLRALASGDFSDTNWGTYMDVFTCPTGTTTPQRVFRWQESGNFYAYFNGTVAGNLTVNGSLTVGGNTVVPPNVAWGQIVSATGTSSIPNDDTLPDSTEGTQIATVTITPSTSSKKVKLSCSLSAYLNAPGSFTEAGLILALFHGSTCIATSRVRNLSDGSTGNASFEANMSINTFHSPASASAQTYSLRIGRFGGGTWYANGPTSSDHAGALDNVYLIAEEF